MNSAGTESTKVNESRKLEGNSDKLESIQIQKAIDSSLTLRMT